MLKLILLICMFSGFVNCFLVNSGPTFKSTKGEIWPLVENENKTHEYFEFKLNEFEFKITHHDCYILQKALERYKDVIRKNYESRLVKQKGDKQNSDHNRKGQISILQVNLKNSCSDNEYPYYGMVEEYHLKIEKNSNELQSESIWGIIRGLESFSQLVYLNDDHTELLVNRTTIFDRPKYSHRGILMDTSRHYIPMKEILANLDAMAYTKLNVFHWHLTDDQSFPYESITFPNMSEKGAYDSKLVYTQEDVRYIIEYARLRGIRVIPEFDTPGHTASWGLAIPGLLTSCYEGRKPSGLYGPIDPSKESTYTFMENFLQEVSNVFPDDYIHLGGDEVIFLCWKSNPHIIKFMKTKYLNGNFEGLQNYYMQKIHNIAHNLKAKPIVWQEVFTNRANLDDKTIVHIWKIDDFKIVMTQATRAGKNVLFSSCYYLDQLATGADWIRFYKCDAEDFVETEEQKKLIVGGEACLWTEFINEFNIIARIWPRAAAVAEKLWSVNAPTLSDPLPSPLLGNLLNVVERLEEHGCRLIRRGIGAQPTSPGFCI